MDTTPSSERRVAEHPPRGTGVVHEAEAQRARGSGSAGSPRPRANERVEVAFGRARRAASHTRPPTAPNTSVPRSPRRHSVRRLRRSAADGTQARSGVSVGAQASDGAIPRSRWRRARRRSARTRPGGSGCRRARGSSSSAGTSRRRARPMRAESSSPSTNVTRDTMNSSSNTSASNRSSIVEHRARGACDHDRRLLALVDHLRAARVLERLRHDLAHPEDDAERLGDALGVRIAGQRRARSRDFSGQPASCTLLRTSACASAWPRGSAPTPRRW